MFFQKIKAVFEWISARRMKQSRKVLDYPWTTHQSIRQNSTPTESSASGSGRAEPERPAAVAQTAAPAASAAPVAPTAPESAESAAPQSEPAVAKRTRAAKGTTTAKKSAAKKPVAAKKSTAKKTTAKAKTEPKAEVKVVEKSEVTAAESATPTTPAVAEEKPERARKTTKMAKAAKTAKMPEKPAEKPVEKPAEEPAATVAATDAVPAPEVKTEAKEAKEAKSPAAPARRTRRTHPKLPAGTLPWGEEEEKLSGLRVTSLRGGAKRRVTADSPGADFLVGRSLKELRTMVQERFPEAAAIGRASKFAFWLDSHREGREFLAEKLEGTVRRRGRPPKATTEDKAKK